MSKFLRASWPPVLILLVCFHLFGFSFDRDLWEGFKHFYEYPEPLPVNYSSNYQLGHNLSTFVFALGLLSGIMYTIINAVNIYERN